MRLRLRLLALALTAQLASGCFAFDEIDKGEKLMEENSGVRQQKAKEEAAAKAAAKAGTPAEGEKKKSWWETARTISAADKAPTDDPHVRCRIEGKERFMLQSDCVTQGGRPL